jgi:hypothetical protein
MVEISGQGVSRLPRFYQIRYKANWARKWGAEIALFTQARRNGSLVNRQTGVFTWSNQPGAKWPLTVLLPNFHLSITILCQQPRIWLLRSLRSDNFRNRHKFAEVSVMDRTAVPEQEYSDDHETPDRFAPSRRKFKKRRGFNKKSRRAARPTTYMGQRSNSHPRSGM